MLWLLAALGVMSVLNFVLNYAVWVVLCDLANQDRASREMDDMANIFAEHVKES